MRRLGVETYPGLTRVAVETMLSKLGVDTKLRAKVSKFWVETSPNKLGVETYPGDQSVLVDTKFKRLGVET